MADVIHPKNKQDVGRRLALWALARDYNQPVVFSVPLYDPHQREGKGIRIFFTHAGSGLMAGSKHGLEPVSVAQDRRLQGFLVAGRDKVWKWAQAVIDGNTVVVSSPDVPEPVAVRYGFFMNPEGVNLYNKDGLPASPFRACEEQSEVPPGEPASARRPDVHKGARGVPAATITAMSDAAPDGATA